jgi:hypothetical protein
MAKKTKEKAQAKSLSDHKVQMTPDMSKGRGMGSAFAYSVGEMVSEIRNSKKQRDFLGKPSETISVEEMTKLVQGK